MADLEFIAKNPGLAPSQDWAFLRSEGLTHVERLGRERWTDYNVHDPGITFLELLCYGIAELGYRTGYGIADLLTEIEEGVAVNRSDFHTARRVLTSGPVSFDDLRKLLIDVHGVKNAWLEPHTSIRYHIDKGAQVLTDAPVLPRPRPDLPRPGIPRPELPRPRFPLPDLARFAALLSTQNEPLSGLYDVFVEYDDFVVEEPGTETVNGEEEVTREQVRLAVAERLHAHRNLCEDFVNVCELAIEEIALCADLDLRPDADVEEVLAEIFDRVERHVSPQVTFYTLEEMLERGKEPDEIFSGPPLDHGFIDDDELRALRRRCEIRASDVIKILMDVDGVKAVRGLWLLSFLDGADEPRAQEEWMLTLATDRFRAPVFARRRSKVIFYKNGLPYYASRSEVETLLAARRAEEVASKVLGPEQDLPVPAGTFRDPGVYDALQNELPRTYGVGQVRIPASQPPLRKAQAKQLKAYLLLFEQLLANHLAQLAHVRHLFSWRAEDEASYFTQVVDGIAGLEEIYDQDLLDAEHGGSLAAALAAIVEDGDTAAERRGRFLDHLLARFAEDLSEYRRLMATLEENADARVIDDQRKLLQDYPRVGARRAQGYDLRRPDDADNLTGYALRVYRLLGIRDATWRQLAGHRFELEEVEVNGEELWRFVLRNDGSFPPEGEPPGEDAEILFASAACESAAAVEVLLDFVVDFGCERAHYRESADGTVWELVRECPGKEPHVLGATTTLRALDAVLVYFATHGEGAEGFHVVEHVLLRKRTTEDPFLPVQIDAPGQCQCVEVRDPYTFRATVFLPSWPRRFRDLRFRHLVEDTLRVEAPAHVYLKVCWISHLGMKRFEIAWEAFRGLLADLAQNPPACRQPDLPAAAAPLTGQLPLPPTGPEHAAYRDALAALIEELHGQVTVHPLARLHDCEETTGKEPQITLNHTSLGTF